MANTEKGLTFECWTPKWYTQIWFGVLNQFKSIGHEILLVEAIFGLSAGTINPNFSSLNLRCPSKAHPPDLFCLPSVLPTLEGIAEVADALR